MGAADEDLELETQSMRKGFDFNAHHRSDLVMLNAFRRRLEHQYMREGEAKKVALILRAEFRLILINPDIAYLGPFQQGTHPVFHYSQ